VIRLDGHQFWLFHTEGVEHALDLRVLSHDWFVKARCLAYGRFLLKDEPDVQYADWEHWVRLPDDRIEWSPLLADERFVAAFRAASDVADPEPGRAEPAFVEIFEALHERGHVVRYGHDDAVIAPRVGLVRHADFSVQAPVDGDVMLLYRFDSAEHARAYAGTVGHAMAADNYVFRSWPPDVWWLPRFEIGQKPDAEVGWSRLVDDDAFRQVSIEAIRALKESFRRSRARW